MQNSNKKILKTGREDIKKPPFSSFNKLDRRYL